MEQKLFTEIGNLYDTSRENPIVIRIKVRMRDLIDPDALRYAVDTSMRRYPYFCVELRKKDGAYIFAENTRQIVISHSARGVELNSKSSNYHMVAFAWIDNWIILDVFHALTDGTGVYELLRTFLYYYCSERYQVTLQGNGIRLLGDKIPEEEWDDPTAQFTELPSPTRIDIPKALNLVECAGLQDDSVKTTYSVTVPESEFMRFNIENDGSPVTMIALLFSRAIARTVPDAEDPIRIYVPVNLRTVLHAPLAHQGLVGGAMLEYREKLRTWPLERQATAYRGMILAQTRDEALLSGLNAMNGISRLILSGKTDQERKSIAEQILSKNTRRILTADVTYVGKANFREAESYIRDFRTLTSPTGGGSVPIIAISAVNGRFVIDITQPFSSPVYVNAFLRELEENGLTYDLQEVSRLELPNVRLPWLE